MSTENQSVVMARKFDKVCSILEEHAYDPNKLITILQAIQHEYRYLPEKILSFVATSLNVSPAKVYGVATFYSHFALKPKGKYIIKVCAGTACHVKDSELLVHTVREKLGLQKGENTTSDMLFTLETVSCLGACGLAPVVVVNEEVYSLMTKDKTREMIDDIMRKEVEVEEHVS